MLVTLRMNLSAWPLQIDALEPGRFSNEIVQDRKRPVSVPRAILIPRSRSDTSTSQVTPGTRVAGV